MLTAVVVLCVLLIVAMFAISRLLDIVGEYEQAAHTLRDKMAALVARAKAES